MGIFNWDKEEEANPFTKFRNQSDTLEDAQFSSVEPEQSAPKCANSTHTATRTVRYGIENAIDLMRKLPDMNLEVVVIVVKKTLESANIKVAEIIADAEKKEAAIEEKANKLRAEINELQARIEQKNKDIAAIQTGLSDIKKVKDQLVLSEELEKAEARKTRHAQQQTQQQAQAPAPKLSEASNDPQPNPFLTTRIKKPLATKTEEVE